MEAADNPDNLERSLLLFCSFMLGLIFIGGVTSNLLVLLVFYRKPGLRTTANRFVINLMIINIVACLSLLPVSLSDNTTTGEDNIYLCFAEQFSSIFCSSVIVYAVLLIAIDQYFAVVDPLHYHYIISSCKGYLMVISSWGFSTVLALLGALQPDFKVSCNRTFRQCNTVSEESTFKRGSSASLSVPEVKELQEKSHNLYRLIFSVGYITTAFVVPLALITFIYYRICAAASGNSKRTRTSMIANEDNSLVAKDRSQGEKSEVEKLNYYASGSKNSEKEDNVPSDQPESSSLLHGSQESSNPSLVVTRPSPPRLAKSESKSDAKCECAKEDMPRDCGENRTPEGHGKTKVEPEVPFLKPTLKNNHSFTKLSSLHIQFANSIEKFNGNERRHSNIPMTVLDPEFENLSKTRSSSVQSNFYEIPSRSSSSTRSTATSIYIQSSRSSSLNSTSTRLPPSRASSIRSTSSYIVHNIRHRISNASLFRYREEARAARISAMVIVMALFCWLPFFTVFFLHYGLCFGKLSNFSHYFDGLSVVLLLNSTIISPFLFAFRNRQIKKEIKKLFNFYPKYLKRNSSKSFYKHNFSLTLKSHGVHLFTEVPKNNQNDRQNEPWSLATCPN